MKQQHGTVIHIVFHVYVEEGHLNRERKIVDLSQQLPRVGKWRDFLTNCKNKSFNVVISSFFLTESKDMGKDVYVTKGNHCCQSTVEEPNNAVEVLDLKSNHREVDPRIVLHTVFASSADKSSKFCVVADDTDECVSVLPWKSVLSTRCWFIQRWNHLP